ncbi:MAG: hypothetical protein PHD83_01605 [Caldisericia bacterium]|nr:hypothetical protein [Caldisericia bacterium]
MDSAYLFTSEDTVASYLVGSVHFFSDIEMITYQDWKKGLTDLRQKSASIIFFSEDFPKEQFNQFIHELRHDPMLEYISVFLLMESWTQEKIKKWLHKSMLDGWIELQADTAIKQIQLKNGIQKTYSQKRLQKLLLDNQFVQSELYFFERKRKYLDQKANHKRKKEAAELMHIVRTYLTVVKDGIQIVLNEEVSDEQKETAVNLIFRNIRKIEEYVNDHENQIQEEQKEITQQFKIIPIQSLIATLEKSLLYEAREKNISLIIEPKESIHSIILKSEDLELMLIELFQAILSLVKPGSVVYLTAHPLLSANTIEMKWITDIANMEPSTFSKTLEDHFQTIEWLDDKESKFEKILNADQIGFRFTLVRLT